MKAILMSIRPRHDKNILNGIKLWEIRKKFPIDYVGWVYIYVTKALPHLSKTYVGDYEVYDDTQWDKEWLDLNGKVVARFWCDKVEDYVYGHKWSWEQGAPMWGVDNSYEKILKDTCLTDDELRAYTDELSFSAIHITKLEIFDKPKEISEFKRKETIIAPYMNYKSWDYLPLTRAPQSYCYIEV